MKLVILYGAPATGKLTVATELARLTGYKLIHNHLIFNICISLYERFSKPLEVLYDDLFLVVLRNALENNISGVITTMCCDDARARPLFSTLQDKFVKEKLSVYFVQVVCDASEIKKRVTSPERKHHGKLCDSSTIDDILSQDDYATRHTGSTTLSIDTSRVTPQASGMEIVSFLEAHNK